MHRVILKYLLTVALVVTLQNNVIAGSGEKQDRLEMATPVTVSVPENRPDITRMVIGDLAPMFLAGNESADAPSGHLSYCLRYLNDCQPSEIATEEQILLPLRDELLQEVIDVNRLVNWELEPKSDIDQYQSDEWWEYPVNQAGDCEDYALEKRRQLIARGWPAWSVLLTRVIWTDETGKEVGHIVLTVRFEQGDLVLDNMVGDVLPWQYSPNELVSRQTAANPALWEKIDDYREPEMFAAIEADFAEVEDTTTIEQ